MLTEGAMPILCDALEDNIAEIVAEWKRLTSKPPWATLTSSQWVDHLPPLLHAMIDGVVCGNGSHDARRKVIESGIRHGSHRRALGVPLDTIFEEYYQLRTATWHLLTTRAGAELGPRVVAEILRLDAAIGVATLASLRGYHRLEFEKTREWDQVIDDLVKDWEHTSLTQLAEV
jgi:hypothetical protein